MDDIILWLQLQLAFGGTAAAAELLNGSAAIEELFSASPQTLALRGRITPALAEKLQTAHAIKNRAKTAAAQCRNFGWAVLTPQNPAFPAELLRLPDPPLAIYAAGNIQKLTAADKAAVVGTRSPSNTALRAAYDLSAALSQNGITVVSGGALGVDSAAHEGALTGPGGTLCVLGSGLGSGYLPEKVFMRRRIEQNGALISELPPFTPPTRNTFPRRNRLIAALGRTLFMAQSEETGGSMITAKYAQKMHKKIFVLSESVFASPGGRLLASRGAEEIASTGPVTAFYGFAESEDWPFLTGGALPPVLEPAKLSPESFAALNGVSNEEALPLYRELRERNYTVPPVPAPVEAPALQQTGRGKQPPAPAATPPAVKQEIAAAQALTGDARAVFLALENVPHSLDELTEATGLPAAAVMTALTLLELSGLAQTLPGNRAALTV